MIRQQYIDHCSPFPAAAPTPSDVSFGTPRNDTVASPSDAPSPFSLTLQNKTSAERAQMFFQGKHGKLLQLMTSQERR